MQNQISHFSASFCLDQDTGSVPGAITAPYLTSGWPPQVTRDINKHPDKPTGPLTWSQTGVQRLGPDDSSSADISHLLEKVCPAGERGAVIRGSAGTETWISLGWGGGGVHRATGMTPLTAVSHSVFVLGGGWQTFGGLVWRM